MLKTLRTFGILAWTGCLFTLIFQGGTWLLTGKWPTLTLLGLGYDLFGTNVAAPARSMSLEFTIKALYVLTITELSLALWWIGTGCFILAMVWRIFRK